MAKRKIQKSNKTRILARYGVITLLFLLLSVLIVIKLFNTTVVNAKRWNEAAEKTLGALDTIHPDRGNILADNGSILACNLQVYDVKVDLRHEKVKKLKGLTQELIDSLADTLDLYYPLKDFGGNVPDKNSPDSWHAKLTKEFNKDADKRTRTLRIVKKGTLDDFERIKTFPLLNRFKGKGSRNPVYTEEKRERIYPFGRMAYRSIGRVSQTNDGFHGYSGLERDLDSLLYGEVGLAKKVMMTSGVGQWTHTAPVRGFDIQTTINIDMQDLLEEELTKVCMNSSAEWGTAILMEVETGEIKAIANVEKMNDGTYGEALNRAVRGFEPGSVIKPISLMIAFEDGLVKSVNDVIDCSPFQQTKDPHAPAVKSMKQVIEMSSNTGIARVLFRGYAKDPYSYHDRLEKIGFFSPMQSGISGEEMPSFPGLKPTDNKGNKLTMTARHLTLARHTYGYAATIPPLYTLAYYNAIANGGKMVKPHLMKRMIGDDIDSVVDIEKLSMRVCSPETAEKVRICLREPVWGQHGTARKLQDERVEIAGKTGTAYPVAPGGGYDQSRRRFAFAGFFPYSNPKYTCIALVLAPSGQSAASTSGEVVKNMALKLYSRGLLDNSSNYTAGHQASTPVFFNTDRNNLGTLASRLNVGTVKSFVDKYKNTPEGPVVPDLAGYDALSAVRILEQKGWNVVIDGSGYVCSQTPAPGTTLRRGDRVQLKLRI